MFKITFKILSAILLFSFALPARAAEVGYKGGFFIENDEKTFKFKMNGRVQPKFQFTDSTTGRGAVTFLMRRAFVSFRGTIHDKTSFGFALFHSTRSNNFSSVNMSGLTLDHEFSEALVASVGMVGIPLDMIGNTSSGWLLTTEYPIVISQSDSATPFTATRDSFGSPDGLGINLSGDIGKFFYSWSIVNGSESNYALNPDMSFSTGGRVGINILGAVGGSLTDYACSRKPKWTASMGAIYQGKRTDDAFTKAADEAGRAANAAPTISRIMTFSGGTGFRYAGFSAQAEAYYRMTKFSNFGDLPAVFTTDSTLEDFGYYVALGYYIIPKKFEIAAQLAHILRQGPQNDAISFGGGVNYYIVDNNLKTQLSYELIDDFNDVTGVRNNKRHKIALQLQAGF